MPADSKSAPKAPTHERYDDVVQRLEGVVKRLEGGELSLEDSLKAFEEGIGLVKSGERMLSEAEKRIEQLLSDGEDRIAPLEVAPQATSVARAAPRSQGKGEEDIPF